jgi:hypothetical protein
VTEPVDVDRLSRNWFYWCGLAQLGDVSVSTECEDCEVLFSSDEYAVHLRHDGDDVWCVDTVNDRRQRQNDTATFSNFTLAEKYLVWVWGSTARSAVRAPILGRRLYDLGFDAGVEVVPISEGIYKLRSPEGLAVLMEPYATIFSHLMGTSEEDIERMLTDGLAGGP